MQKSGVKIQGQEAAPSNGLDGDRNSGQSESSLKRVSAGFQSCTPGHSLHAPRHVLKKVPGGHLPEKDIVY